MRGKVPGAVLAVVLAIWTGGGQPPLYERNDGASLADPGLGAGTPPTAQFLDEFQTPRGFSFADAPSLFAETPLVVGPADQVDPDFHFPYLAFEHRSATFSSILVLNVTDGRVSGVGGYGPWQRYPRLTGALLGYSSGYHDTPGGCSGGFCSYIADLSAGELWAYSGPGTTPVAVADPYFAQIDPFASPGFARTLQLRYITNGSLWQGLGIAEPWVEGPVATEDVVVLSVRRGALCIWGYDWQSCVNELGFLFLGNLTLVRLTESVRLYEEWGPTQWYLSNCGDFTFEASPSITGSSILWEDNRNSQFQLDPGNCTWSGQFDIYRFDLDTWTESPLRANPWDERDPDGDGEVVAWADNRNGNWDIYAIDLSTGQEVQVTDDPSTQQSPVVSQGCIAWEDYRNGDSDIYGRCLFELNEPARKSLRRDPPEEHDEVTWVVNRTVTRDRWVPAESRVQDPAIPRGHAGMDLAATSVEKNRTASRARSSVAS